MNRTTVQVLATRPLQFRGAPVAAGGVIDATPLEAIDLCGSTRAQLVDPADQAALKAAWERQVAEDDRQSRGTFRPRHW